MPLYEYECKACGTAFETLVRGNETPKCPACASVELAQLMSVTAAPGSSSSAAVEPGPCGKPACARGCMNM